MPRKKPLSLEEVLAAAKALGLTVSVPTQAQETERQEGSKDLLGMVTSSKPPEPVSGPELRLMLYATHIIGGVSYGPGEVVLPSHQTDLYRSLTQQDQACVRGHMDIAQYQPVARCFLIKPGNNQDRHNKFRKQEVSEAVFNSEQAFLGEVGITAGAYDIAGYKPGFNSEAQSF